MGNVEQLEVDAVGWGHLYSEGRMATGEGDEDDPVSKGDLIDISSCMTSETGPLESRFSPCKLEQNKVMLHSMYCNFAKYISLFAGFSLLV